MSGCNDYRQSKVCAFCNHESQTLKKCGQCKNVWYCDAQHQREHWRSHKPVCSAVTEINYTNSGPHNESVKKKKGKKRANGLKNGKVINTETNSALHLLNGLSLNQGPKENEATSKLQDIDGGGCTKPNRRRNRSRKASLEPNLSTPIDNGGEIEVSSSLDLDPTSPSLVHQDVHLAQKITGLIVGTDLITDVADLVVQDLNQFGICVVDDFLGSQQSDKIFDDVRGLYDKGVLRDGEVVSQSVQAQAREKIRGDKITWVSGTENSCLNIGQLCAALDAIISVASKHTNAGNIAEYNIKTRTRVMVACYPGSGAHYVKHVDNPNEDGRCITAIYYLNKDWQKEDGGVLRVYPEDSHSQVAEIEPIFDRLLFFWSDRRNPHEVLPAKMTRYALTVWYLNQDEREAYLSKGRECIN